MPKHLSLHQKNISPRVRLRLAREAAGWSQEELGVHIGTGQVTVSRWETGETTPSPYFRKRLSQIFGKHPQDLDLESSGGIEAVSETVLYDPLIPQQPRALVGREEDLSYLKERLIGGHQMILSAINGLPGVGKTTLAVAVAHDPEVRAAFPDGILWVGLGTTPDVIAHLRRWGTILGVEEAQMTSGKVDDLALTVRSAIGERRMLLVIDDAWKIEDALAFKIGGPRCIHLITTRILPIAVQLSPHDTVLLQELSVERSLDLLSLLAPQVVEREPSKARSLAQSVGGLPLALTLMGNYLRQQATGGQSRRVQAALERLNHAETRLHLSEPQGPAERHPGLSTEQPLSLHAVIGITDQRLSEQAREALYALSVLPPKPDTFSEMTALAVCACAPHILDDLVDTGLLESGGDGRYMLHQTVADYARTHLSSSFAAQRLIDYAHSFIENHQVEYELLDLERSTIFAALEAASLFDRQADLVRGVCAFAPFLLLRGNYTLAERYLSRAYQAALALNDLSGLTNTCLYQGQIFLKQGNYVQSVAFFQRGLALAPQSIKTRSELLADLGWVTWKQGDHAKANDYLQEGLALARERGDEEIICKILRVLGSVVCSLGENKRGIAYLQEGLSLARHIGNQEQLCVLLIDLGTTMVEIGENVQAEVYLHQGLVLAKQIGHKEWMSLACINLADLHFMQGKFAQSEEYSREGLAIARQLGHKEWICGSLVNLGISAAEQGKNEQAENAFQELMVMAQKLDRPYITTFAFHEYGVFCIQQGRLEEAAKLLEEMRHLLPKGGQKAEGSWQFAMARLFYAQGDLNQAKHFGEESKKTFQTIEDTHWRPVAQWLQERNF